MEHLLELAKELLPVVRGAEVESDLSDRVRQVDAWCRKTLEDQETRLKRRLPLTWDAASEMRAREILADVLAQHAEVIPDLLAAVEMPDFRPPFLAALVDAAFEAAQEQYRPRTWLDYLWWYAWAWIAAAEYLALRRDRHHKVAAVLAQTRSWRDLAESRRAPSTPPPTRESGEAPPPAVGSANAPGRLTRRARSYVVTGVDRVRSRIATWRGKDGDWRAVTDYLTSEQDTGAFRSPLEKELLVRPWLVLQLAEVTGIAAPFSMAFARELREIQASRRRRIDNPRNQSEGPSLKRDRRAEMRPRYPARRAAEMKLVGVALSGGGIRSATFNLGVLQGLAQLRLLRHVDYLSTVSGGGYVGAWLTGWIKRAQDERQRGVRVVEERLEQEPVPAPDDLRFRPLRFLREHSNYLTPRAGFFSADTWTMFAVWLRNTLLNQAVLVLMLGGILLLPWDAWYALTTFAPLQTADQCKSFMDTLPWPTSVAAAVLITAAAVSGDQLRRFNLRPEQRRLAQDDMLGQRGVIGALVAPVIVAAILLSSSLFATLPCFADDSFRSTARAQLTVLFAICLALVAVGGQFWRCFTADRVSSTPTKFRSALWAFAIIAMACGAAAFAGASLLVFAASQLSPHAATPESPTLSWHWLVWGTPATVAAFSLMIVVDIGLLGRNLSDEHREWWSRLGAWLNIASLAWLAIFAFAIYSPYLLALAWGPLGRWIVASGGVGWATWTGLGVLLGKSEKTSGLRDALTDPRWRKWIVALAPYVFVAGLLILMSTAAFWLVVGDSPLSFGQTMLDQPHWSQFRLRRTWLLWAPVTLMALAFLLSCRIDINEFSMHHFYKNRLVRCYLGAARDRRLDGTPRAPDPFTGFDPTDDLKIADLRLFPGGFDTELRDVKRRQNPEDLAPYIGPVPIVNAALNLVKGDDLAWQERKALSFVFTPFYSGYEYIDGSRARGTRFAQFGFRPTILYGYPPFGVALGTATAISGAAASPNMGYHSSPSAAFLMTMFNARLGWWMGNPRDEHNWLRSSPRRGLLYLLNELFGLTNDRTHFVNLSDGGHFENLGIYELVRRRCRFIIACDAEQDQALTFNGLGNAVRKCRIDFGTEISIRATRIHPIPGAQHGQLHCVVGDIAYPDGEEGTLLFLKASLTGDEPADVLEYSARETTFPHHSTMGDQFFDESQFESYRKLGCHVAQTAFDAPGLSPEVGLEERFAALRDFWYPPSSAIERHFGDHMAQYDALLERARSGPGLDFLDPAFFGAAVTAAADRDKFYIGASMLDLMQRVFIDLDLERDAAHPHNAGWMTIFREWAHHPAVTMAWTASKKNYGTRFQRFVDHL